MDQFDVTLACMWKQIPCHRRVLAEGSNYFRTLFLSGMKDSDSPLFNLYFNPDVVTKVVALLYGEKLEEGGQDELLALMEVAFYLQADEVFDSCCKKYLRGVTPESVFNLMNAAYEFGSGSMVKTLNAFITDNIKAVASTKEFLTWKPLFFKNVFSHPDFRLVPHNILFDVFIPWIDRNGWCYLTQFIHLLNVPTESNWYVDGGLTEDDIRDMRAIKTSKFVFISVYRMVQKPTAKILYSSFDIFRQIYIYTTKPMSSYIFYLNGVNDAHTELNEDDCVVYSQHFHSKGANCRNKYLGGLFYCKE